MGSYTESCPVSVDTINNLREEGTLTSEQALSHLRVIDVSHHIAGPYCTKLLAELGAEVIKIERPDRGDPARRIGPFPNDDPHPEKSALFLHLNTNKKSITLNLKSEPGKELFKELVRRADIVVENFRPEVMPNLGLGYEVLEKINPKLVMTSISNFGQYGPYRDYKATDIVEYALSGFMYMMGNPDQEPLKHVGYQAQYQAGIYAFVGSLAAVYLAEETGEGQYVDISIQEVMTSIDEYGIPSWVLQHHIYKRRGNIGGVHPWGIYPCRNGYVGLALAMLPHWRSFVVMLGIEGLQDKKFEDTNYRMLHRDEVDAYMLPWLLEHDKEEVYIEGQRRGIPTFYVRNAENLHNARQYRERGFWVELDHPMTGKLLYPGAPGIMSETPLQMSSAPLLGQHNEEVYCQRLGLSEKDLVKMRQMSVI